MLKKPFLITCVLLFLNCSNDIEDTSGTELLSNFKMSLNHWQNLKRSHTSSYMYTVSSKTNLGYLNQTKITVKKGIVFSRVYEEYTLYDEDNNRLKYENRIILTSFIEDISNIGSHSCEASEDDLNSISYCYAAPALTIDELYNTCLNTYLTVNALTNNIVFEVDDLNLLKNCYYTSNLCSDNCYTGIKLTNFKWL
ncbi:hypothetical protein [Aestuariibaculum sediminum]|uniref:Uncharacterized protein n=1 Tax=Aestuariibaculum sediminum TaxID=2770637 RepID=A0A8J6QA78_9FLAO|nr:hypothetical protein [Aestuariibaculum sediminum]MBD0833157.1 hypothetical protein [Aestuariibaculum sediminum]